MRLVHLYDGDYLFAKHLHLGMVKSVRFNRFRCLVLRRRRCYHLRLFVKV